MSDYTNFTGTPQIIQNQGAPSDNQILTESQLAAFNQGILLFFWDRENTELYFLQFIDSETGLQTWTKFPMDPDTLMWIGFLPVLQKLYWCVSNSNPSDNENINPVFYDNSYGILWWCRVTGSVFKMTSWDSDAGTQVWTQII